MLVHPIGAPMDLTLFRYCIDSANRCHYLAWLVDGESRAYFVISAMRWTALACRVLTATQS